MKMDAVEIVHDKKRETERARRRAARVREQQIERHGGSRCDRCRTNDQPGSDRDGDDARRIIRKHHSGNAVWKQLKNAHSD